MTAEDLKVLIAIAHHYERAMGPMRFVLPIVARKDVKTKYRFVAEESRWLERFAVAAHDEIIASGRSEAPVNFTPLALVAFWGRLLASLETPRSRRKLSGIEVQARETLAARLQGAGRQLRLADSQALENELRTRRPVEAQWMRERLADGVS